MGLRAGAVAVGLCLMACAGGKASAPSAANLAKADASRKFVDRDLGFEITRPRGDWVMDAKPSRLLDGVAVPVVMKHRDGAQVVVQVAPTVASPTQFAERLNEGLSSQPGFTASAPEPLAYSDNAVGFQFLINDDVEGKVAILEGRTGHTYLVLATWPTGSDASVPGSIEEILGSLRTY